ncbi:MAG: pantoate--beta-alanine ligase [Methylotenera sp.]|nr:pantoate--beta-alanine ligase [Oligoflexia bacterium]
MILLTSIAELRSWRNSPGTETVGFVPTMGALHAGHESLLEKARSENDRVCLSIFVNPTQFNNPDDFANYPKTMDRDLEVARRNRVDAVFAPVNPKELYPDEYHFKAIETSFSKELCGAFRTGHFEGVLTIVLKLLLLTRATRAYFGEKDFQQLSLIRGMVQAFFIDTEIRACPTLREADGLALSSRNVRLTRDERALAPTLYRALSTERDLEIIHSQLTERGFEVEYLAEIHGRRFIAAHLGKVRLIDNTEFHS